MIKVKQLIRDLSARNVTTCNPKQLLHKFGQNSEKSIYSSVREGIDKIEEELI